MQSAFIACTAAPEAQYNAQLRMTNPPKYRAPALNKGLDILELLSSASKPLNLTEIADGVGYSSGEIFRMLQVLEERQYIARGPGDAGYSLTNRLFMLGMERPQNKGLVEHALPVMHRLSDEILHPCHLVVASEDQIVVIARVDAPSDLGFVVRIGHRRPMAHSTSGVLLFAFQSDEVRRRWLAILDAADASYNRKRFLARAAQIRKQGYASIQSEVVDAVLDLSAPILRKTQAVGALSVPYVERRPPKVTKGQALQKLRAAVDDISRQMAQ
jgi:DNA-binding IclR family transcriptional regulator